MSTGKKRNFAMNRFETLDVILCIILSLFALMIIVPFINVIAVSFTTSAEYARTPVLLFPQSPTLENYKALISDARIGVGYRTTLLMLVLGVPINLFLTSSLAYGLSRSNFPGRKFLFYFVLVTMLFNGGIIPVYLLVRDLGLMNTIWSVILTGGINTFYMVIMRNNFQSMPESLIESAKLDGAGEWRILFQVILPLSMPIIATITLFYTVDRWNEWYYTMLFIRKNNLQTLQLVLRAIVLESQMVSELENASSTVMDKAARFTMGIKMATIMATILPIMCVYPFLQKYFTKGALVGAIKA